MWTDESTGSVQVKPQRNKAEDEAQLFIAR